jgi:hypothetical protein
MNECILVDLPDVKALESVSMQRVAAECVTRFFKGGRKVAQPVSDAMSLFIPHAAIVTRLHSSLHLHKDCYCQKYVHQ